ncbi:Glucosaminyl phosphatidylinositol (GlcN-PI) nositol acylation protein [Podila epigama]|nr:Glucosaminyl phosphatidylinositol (GlcN-PI) nositol acylation protein [Podila epigama]
MDVCVFLTDKEGSEQVSAAEFVERIGDRLEKESDFVDVLQLRKARVPIVKLHHISGIACDIGYQNDLAIWNTRLLRAYCKTDRRVRDIVLIVKQWAKKRKINNPYTGSLSSYAYVLLVIHLLQQRGVLPNLQATVEGNGGIPYWDCQGFNRYFFEDIFKLSRYWQPTPESLKQSVGQLLYEFFRYYATEFHYRDDVVSIRKGELLTKEAKEWTKDHTQAEAEGKQSGVKNRYLFCIEDPFETDHNVGRPVDRYSLFTIRGEFMRAAKILSKGSEGAIARLCMERHVPAPVEKTRTGSFDQGAKQGPENEQRDPLLESGENSATKPTSFASGEDPLHVSGSGIDPDINTLNTDQMGVSDAAKAAAEYKAAKEAWVTGHTGGSMTEATLVTASALTTFILWASIQKYHPKSPARRALEVTSKQGKARIRNSVFSYMVDFTTLVVPLILSCTLFADYAYLWSFATIAFSAVIKSICGPPDNEILKKEKKKFKWKESDDDYSAPEDPDELSVPPQEEETLAKSSSAFTAASTSEQDGFRQRKGGQVGDDLQQHGQESHSTLQLEENGSMATRLKSSKTTDKSPHKTFLSVYRAGMMILTCIAILAVDFPIFPRRFGKVEVYGTSLMDLGVGSFVFSSGVVSARGYLKKENLPFAKQMTIALRTSIPLLVLGLGRYISTKGVDYQEHVTEYGMHWNFFFTLGFLPIFVTFFRSLAEHIRFSILGSMVAVVYQIFLTYGGLEHYIQNAPRVDIISMNKEGIFSFAGYLAIFLVGVDVGLYVLPNDPYFFMRRKSNKKKAKKGKLAMILVSLCFMLCLGFMTSYGILQIPVSQITLTRNEPSALAIARAQAKANLSTSGSKHQRPSQTVLLPPLTCPPLLEAVNRNGLAVFLVANVLTGLVNMSIQTLYTSDAKALIILTAYMALVTGVAWVWQVRGWKLKL